MCLYKTYVSQVRNTGGVITETRLTLRTEPRFGYFIRDSSETFVVRVKAISTRELFRKFKAVAELSYIVTADCNYLESPAK